MADDRERDKAELPTTSVTLVRGLRSPEQRQAYEDAWVRFHLRYSPVIFDWFRHFGRLDADRAAEETQHFHVRLVSTMRSFEYNPEGSFRGWLAVGVRNHLLNYFRDRKEWLSLDGRDWLAAAESVNQRLQEAFDLELLNQACRRVRNRVSSRDWEIFHTIESRGETVESVAERLDVTTGVVYTVKWRVKKMLSDEVRRLESDGGPEDAGPNEGKEAPE